MISRSCLALLRLQLPRACIPRQPVRFATSIVDVKERPLPKLNASQKPLDQLIQITQYSLWDLKARLLLKKLAYPYESLNKLTLQEVDTLLSSFEKTIVKRFTAYLSEGSHLPISSITLSDYFRPRIDTITPLIFLIHLNMYPNDLAAERKYQSKLEIITAMLTDLFHQHYIEYSLVSVQAHDRVQTTWDIGAPAEWYPQARKMKRKIVMHVGPTNSGKTYSSLQAFAKAKSGYYAGPLRLLAREVYEKFQNQGISCNLVTGEEVIPSLDEYGTVSSLSSGTIEMIPLHTKMDMCIIDEIQMLADESRGSAWTNAVLGVQAKELHLCGEESAVSLVKELVKSTGDEIEIKHYKRLGKLTICDSAVGRIKNLRRGDCVIAFSKRKILELKCEIEKETTLKVGVIYGALPPEIRSKEAVGFNEGKYDVLVASDAIGMGLNLKIQRIVFWSIVKFNGTQMAQLSISATKQIAGRAGRFSAMAGELEGFVTTFNPRDLVFLKRIMKQPVVQLQKACIWPPNEFWVHYMSSFRKPMPLREAIRKFESAATYRNMKNYFLADFEQQYELLDIFLGAGLHERMTIEDQLQLCLAPVNFRTADTAVIETAIRFFDAILRCESKTVFDFDFLHSTILLLDLSLMSSQEKVMAVLQALETDHKLVLVFMWLSQRWPTIFVDKEGASDIKTLVEKRISEELLYLRRAIKRDPHYERRSEKRAKRR